MNDKFLILWMEHNWFPKACGRTWSDTDYWYETYEQAEAFAKAFSKENDDALYMIVEYKGHAGTIPPYLAKCLQDHPERNEKPSDYERFK